MTSSSAATCHKPRRWPISCRRTWAASASAKIAQRQRQARLAKLDVQEENLLDLISDGEVSVERAKARLRRITAERSRIQDQVAFEDEQLNLGAEVVRQTIAFLDDVAALYDKSSDQGRRLINQALFEKLYVENDEVTDDALNAPFAGFVDLDRTLRQPGADLGPQSTDNSIRAVVDRLWPDDAEGSRAVARRQPLDTETFSLAAALSGGGSSKDVMVELIGIYSNRDLLIGLAPRP